MPDGAALGPAQQLEEVRPEIWLRGQPPLADFLKFIRDKTIGGAALSAKALADDWREANDY